MMTSPRAGRLAAWSALCLAAALAVSGCVSNPLEAVVKENVDKAIEDTTGIDVIEEGTTIPEDFPLAGATVDGTVEQAGALTMGGLKTWSVTLNVGDAASAFAQGKEKLLAAGYEEDFSMDDAGGGVSAWGGTDYDVIFNVTTTDGKTQADYVVSQVE